MSALEEANKEIIRRYQDAFNTNQLDRLDAFMAVDVKTPEMLPGFAPGLEGVKQIHLMTVEAWPNFNAEIEDLVAEGEYVAARLICSATPQKPAFGVEPNGRSFRITGQFIARIVNGKIVEHVGVEDAVGIMQQMGLMPASGSSGL